MPDDQNATRDVWSASVPGTRTGDPCQARTDGSKTVLDLLNQTSTRRRTLGRRLVWATTVQNGYALPAFDCWRSAGSSLLISTARDSAGTARHGGGVTTEQHTVWQGATRRVEQLKPVCVAYVLLGRATSRRIVTHNCDRATRHETRSAGTVNERWATTVHHRRRKNQHDVSQSDCGRRC